MIFLQVAKSFRAELMFTSAVFVPLSKDGEEESVRAHEHGDLAVHEDEERAGQTAQDSE